MSTTLSFLTLSKRVTRTPKDLSSLDYLLQSSVIWSSFLPLLNKNSKESGKKKLTEADALWTMAKKTRSGVLTLSIS